MHIKNIFSDINKEAYVTPIYKKGEPLKAENDKTNSVTRTPAKVFERLSLQQLLENVEMYEMK